MLHTIRSGRVCLSAIGLWFLSIGVGLIGAAIPISFTLEKAGYVTLVLEDTEGKRIENLISETYLSAGAQTIVWSGYDMGAAVNRTVSYDYCSSGYGNYSLEKHLVKPGSYTIRGLFHEGIKPKYEFSVNSGSGLSAPWHTTDFSGGWLADHSSPKAVKFIPGGGGSPYTFPTMIIAAGGSEAGHNLIVVDLNGKKLKGLSTGMGANGWTNTCTNIYRGCECQPVTTVTDAAGIQYVIDKTNHQVRKLSSSGTLLLTIGKAGGVKLGLYDEEKMDAPNGIAVTDNGQLWVAENSGVVRRVSVWSTANGSFIKAFYGSPKYGGGGTIDPVDSTRFYYAGYGYAAIEFKLDWITGTSKPMAVYGISPQGGSLFFPERAFYVNGHQYMVNTYNQDYNSMAGDKSMELWLMENHVIKPVGRFGRCDGDSGYLPFKSSWPLAATKEHPACGTVLWKDLNRDLSEQANELQFRQDPYVGNLYFGGALWNADGSSNINANGSFQCTNREPWYNLRFTGNGVFNPKDLSMMNSWGMKLPAPTISSTGVPLWDLTTTTFPVGQAQYGGGNYIPCDNNWIVHYEAPLRGYKDNKLLWEYHNQWPHRGGGVAPVPAFPGQLISAARLMGFPVTPTVGEAGEFICINGDKGEIYLLTTDGLYLRTIGGDIRNLPYLKTNDFTRGKTVYETECFNDEQFFPTINQTANGGIYLVAGKEYSGILRLDGFQTVKRIAPTTFNITSDMLSGLKDTIMSLSSNLTYRRVDVYSGSKLHTVDGNLGEWSTRDSCWAPIAALGSASVYIGTTKLFAAWKTNQSNLLTNSGIMGDTLLFKTGGCLDLMIATDPQAAFARSRPTPMTGDQRLLITKVGQTLKAMLYTAVVPNTPLSARVLFESPVGQVYFDKVEDVSALVSLASSGTGNYEISIPLAKLGFAPVNGSQYQADPGILRGDGTSVNHRAYWSNQNTGIVSDIPSEARLQPQAWGRLFVKADPTSIKSSLQMQQIGQKRWYSKYATGGIRLNNPLETAVQFSLYNLQGQQILKTSLDGMASFDVPRKIVGNTAGIILYQIVGPDHELSSGQIVLQ